MARQLRQKITMAKKRTRCAQSIACDVPSESFEVEAYALVCSRWALHAPGQSDRHLTFTSASLLHH